MEKIVVIRPKTVQMVGFVYESISDLTNLIKFVGKSPLILTDMTLMFKKVAVKEPCVVFANSFGEVTNVLPPEKIEENFEVVKNLKFAPEYENKVVEKKSPKAKRK